MNITEVLTLFSRYIHRINDIDVIQMCGLAEGTNDYTIKTVTDIVYQLYNQQYTLTAADNIAMTDLSATPQGADTFCYYLISVDVSGNITTTKGTDDTYALPTTPTGDVPIGAIKVTTVGVTFTSGSTDLSAAGITAEFFDIDCGIATTLINQGMRKIENGVTVNLNGFPQRVSNWDHMKVRTTASIVQADTTVTNPIPNYKELITAQLTDANSFTYPPLDKVDMLAIGSSTQARPQVISRLPAAESSLTPDITPTQNFVLWPASDASYTLTLICYQYSPYLDGVIYTSNWWTANHPEALVFAGLVEAEAYLKQDERMNTWKERLDGILAAIAGNQKDERWAGSPQNIRFYDPFNRTTGDIYSFM